MNIIPIPKLPFEMFLELRKYKTLNYLSMGKKVKNFCFVRYEDLEKDPRGFLEYLSKKYNLGLSQTFHPVSTYKGLSGEMRYVKKKYPQFLPWDLEFINQNLDWELEGQIGYERYDDPLQIQNR